MKLNLINSVRSFTSHFALACGMALTSAALHAESLPLRVTIPFGFTVGGHSMPAGEYSIKPLDGFASAVAMHHETDGANVIALVSPGTLSATSKLTFTLMGTERVLAGVNAPTWAFMFPVASGANETKLARAAKVPGMATAIRTQ